MSELQTEILATIKRLSERWPELRIGQLLVNSIPVASRKQCGNDVFYLEDADLLKGLLEYESWVERSSAFLRDCD